MSVTIKYTCKLHPTYKGKLHPRILCGGCHAVFAFATWNDDRSEINLGQYAHRMNTALKIERVKESE